MDVLEPTQIQSRVHAHVRWLRNNKREDGSKIARLVLTNASLTSEMFPAVAVVPNTGRCQLDECDLSGSSFVEQTIEKLLFQDATLNGIRFVDCTLKQCAFLHTQLKGAVFERCTFEECEFTRSTIDDAYVSNCKYKGPLRLSIISAHRVRVDGLEALAGPSQCQMDGATCVAGSVRNAKLVGIDVTSCTISECALSDVNIDKARAKSSRWDRCKWDRVSAIAFNGGGGDGPGYQAQIVESDLKGTVFSGAELRNVVFDGSDLSGSDLRGARLSSAKVRGSRFIDCKGLEGRDAAQQEDLWYTEWAVVYPPRDWLGWTIVRGIGSMPLFSASAVTVAGIVVYGRCVAWYNSVVANLEDGVRPLVAQVATPLFLERLTFPIELSLLLLATVMLAVAAIIFRVLCPELVQEYSQTQWVRQMKGSRLEYLASAWKHRRWRYVCATLYLLGGGYTVSYLLWNGISAVIAASHW